MGARGVVWPASGFAAAAAAVCGCLAVFTWAALLSPHGADAGCGDRETPNCCSGRDNECSEFTRRKTTCYCDTYCQRTGDCCEDYRPPLHPLTPSTSPSLHPLLLSTSSSSTSSTPILSTLQPLQPLQPSTPSSLQPLHPP
ncbi:hypothetical protein CRUP_020678 [Coryphaenoides rupestris]|nr:hypothetical protein CRUP_020678 [Coryphaenoides rupestris]